MSEGNTGDVVKTVAESISGVLEKAPIYEDAAQPALREIGQGLGGMLKMVVLPFKMMGYQSERWLIDFQNRLEKKGETIPSENLQAPDPMLAGPIIQSLGYTLHQEPIREMFTNLLVTGMNSSTANQAHPAFVEIIKQISPDEAKIISWLGEDIKYTFNIVDGKIHSFKAVPGERMFPIANFSKVMKATQGRGIFKRNVCYFAKKSNCQFLSDEEKYIDNLIRLGILKVRFDQWFNDDLYYAEHNQELDLIRNIWTDDGQNELKLDKGTIEVTAFGMSFLSSCLLDLSSLVKE